MVGSSQTSYQGVLHSAAQVQQVLMKSQQLWNHSRVCDCSRSPQRSESANRRRKETTAELKKPSDLPESKRHVPTDSDEDVEVPQNEPGTFSITQPSVPLFSLQAGSTSSSYGPSISTTSASSLRTSSSTSFEDASVDDDYEDGEGESGPAIRSPNQQGQCSTQIFPSRPMKSTGQ